MIMKRTISIFLILILLIVCFNSIEISATQDLIDGKIGVVDGVVTIYGPEDIDTFDDATDHIIDKYKALIVFVGGLVTVTLVGILAVQITQFGASASDPRQRAEALKGIMISGISAALMGSITMFVGLFYGMFR